MNKYRFKAWNNKFEVIKGSLEEDDIDTAREKLKSQGLTIVYIKKAFTVNELTSGITKLKDSELAAFCGQMGIILNSGLNILNGLDVLQSQMKEKKMKNIIAIMHSGVRKGRALASAMEDTRAFPKLLCDMIASGELSGNVDETFFNMEGFYEREGRIKSKIKTASIYPSMLLLVAVGMIFFFNIFVFKELSSLFSDASKLPVTTKALLAFMKFLNGNFIYILLTIGGIILLFIYAAQYDKAANMLDKVKLKFPVVGEFRVHMITARFSRSMSLFLKAGVPMLSIMDSMKLLVGNKYIAVKIEDMKNELINGRSISSALDKQQIFEPMVVQMIKVGEETGRLEDTLTNIANIYDKKIENEVSKMMAMIEPAFTLIIGVCVAVLILAVAMPVMNMTNSLR